MTDYSEHTDYEINKLVAEILYPGRDKHQHDESGTVEINTQSVPELFYEYFNWTDNWYDAGNLLADNKISLSHPNHTGSSHNLWGTDGWVEKEDIIHIVGHHDKNPCRAIAITYLKMQEKEDE